MDRPRSDDLDEWLEHGTQHMGACGYQAYPDATLTEAEAKKWRAELRERQRRRKPLGFAPWPSDEAGEKT